jgi:hypothetical protein
VRIASFNVESLFERPVAMNQKTWADGKQVVRAAERDPEQGRLHRAGQGADP